MSHTLHTLRTRHESAAVPLSSLVARWLAEGIISREQATLISASEYDAVPVRTGTQRQLPRSLATEALGYLGGAVVVVSTILIANLYWEDLSLAARLALLGLAAAGALAAGLAVPSHLGEVSTRLRSVLWLASTLSFAGFLGILGADALDLSEPDTAVFASAGTAALAAVLWRAHRHLLQQVAAMVALMVTAATSIADLVDSDHLPGLGAWAVAAVWMGLALTERVQPARVVLALSSAAAIFTAMTTAPANWGFALAIATVASVVTLAVQRADLVLLAIGAVGTLGVLPSAVNEWFPDTAAVPFVMLAVGLALVGIALWTTRRHRERPDTT
jgi:hypothetical protein